LWRLEERGTAMYIPPPLVLMMNSKWAFVDYGF
jgi:hypothetical protein